jgi:hypothetical protein
MATIVEQMVQQIRTLTAEEQRQIRALLDAEAPQPAGATPEQQRGLAERLFAEGIIENLPARYREGYNPEEDADRHPPVVVQGRPVSETLLEDREPR